MSQTATTVTQRFSSNGNSFFPAETATHQSDDFKDRVSSSSHDNPGAPGRDMRTKNETIRSSLLSTVKAPSGRTHAAIYLNAPKHQITGQYSVETNKETTFIQNRKKIPQGYGSAGWSFETAVGITGTDGKAELDAEGFPTIYNYAQRQHASVQPTPFLDSDRDIPAIHYDIYHIKPATDDGKHLPPAINGTWLFEDKASAFPAEIDDKRGTVARYKTSANPQSPYYTRRDPTLLEKFSAIAPTETVREIRHGFLVAHGAMSAEKPYISIDEIPENFIFGIFGKPSKILSGNPQFDLTNRSNFLELLKKNGVLYMGLSQDAKNDPTITNYSSAVKAPDKHIQNICFRKVIDKIDGVTFETREDDKVVARNAAANAKGSSDLPSFLELALDENAVIFTPKRNPGEQVESTDLFRSIKTIRKSFAPGLNKISAYCCLGEENSEATAQYSKNLAALKAKQFSTETLDNMQDVALPILHPFDFDRNAPAQKITQSIPATPHPAPNLPADLCYESSNSRQKLEWVKITDDGKFSGHYRLSISAFDGEIEIHPVTTQPTLRRRG